VSPILVRPVREQLEHDRVVRLLQARWRKRYQVATNRGGEQNEAVGTGPGALYPDLILSSKERGRRIQAVVEVETGESVNNLEALAQWAPLARQRARFQLYVPAGSVEVARRLCTGHNIAVAEIWSYHSIGDQVRFTPVYRVPAPQPAPRRVAATKTRVAVATRRSTVARRSEKAKKQRPGKPARKATRAQKRK